MKKTYRIGVDLGGTNIATGLVDENNKVAKQSIEQLSDLLRYQLYDIEKEVTMEQEINYLRSYIAFQQLRMSERLMLDLYFDPQLKEQKIHPLLLQIRKRRLQNKTGDQS